jgi:hypothetical protein
LITIQLSVLLDQYGGSTKVGLKILELLASMFESFMSDFIEYFTTRGCFDLIYRLFMKNQLISASFNTKLEAALVKVVGSIVENIYENDGNCSISSSQQLVSILQKVVAYIDIRSQEYLKMPIAVKTEVHSILLNHLSTLTGAAKL